MRAQSLPILVLLLAIHGCRQAKPSPPAQPAATHRLESAPLQIALARVPSGFTAVPGAVNPLRLTAADGGEVAVFRGTRAEIHEAARAEEDRVERLPGGRFLGSAEMLCQLGPGMMTRERYRAKGREVEEIRVFTTPDPGRPLVLAYSYPVGSPRIAQAVEVLRRLERL
jgi:hypothetical protein